MRNDEFMTKILLFTLSIFFSVLTSSTASIKLSDEFSVSSNGQFVVSQHGYYFNDFHGLYQDSLFDLNIFLRAIDASFSSGVGQTLQLKSYNSIVLKGKHLQAKMGYSGKVTTGYGLVLQDWIASGGYLCYTNDYGSLKYT